jgi:hypothetical protein
MNLIERLKKLPRASFASPLRRISRRRRTKRDSRPTIIFTSDYATHIAANLSMDRLIEQARAVVKLLPPQRLPAEQAKPVALWPAEIRKPAGEVLGVRQGQPDGCWEVVRSGKTEAVVHRDEKEDAIDEAVECLSRESGGEVWVMNDTGKVVDRIEVPRQIFTTRSAILREGRRVSERESLPLISPTTARRFNVPADELEFAAALLRVWRDQPEMMSTHVFYMGFAGQYGPYVFWSYYREEPLTIERFVNTATALRRYWQLAEHGPFPGVL